MKTTRTYTVLSVLLVMAWTSSPAQEEAAKPQLKIPKRPVAYRVTREAKTQSSRGDSVTTSDVTYNISLESARDNGDLVLQVAYASLKAKSDSEPRSYDFDSSKDATTDVVADAVRKAIAKPITVTLSGGAIKEITGFPELGDPGDDREARGRQFMIRSLAGSRTLRRDLELILASAVQGQTLEQGKSYRIQRDEARTAAGGGQRRRGFRGFGSDIVFKFEGLQKNRAKFSLSTARRERPDAGGDRPRFDRKETSEGTAIVGVKNGMLAKLSLNTKTEMSGEFQGQEFKFTRESKVTVQRQRANQKGAGQKKNQPKKNRKNKKTGQQ